MILPEFRDLESSQLNHIPEQAMFENTNIKQEHTDSPDSGHREMSSDSLSYNLNQNDLISSAWYTPMSKMGMTGFVSGATGSGQQSNPFTSPDSGVGEPLVPGQDTPTRRVTPVHHAKPIGEACTPKRLELNVTPRIDPPPRVKRSSRSPNTSSDTLNPDSTTQSSSSQSSSHSSTTSENSLTGSDKRNSRDSIKLEDAIVKPENKELNTSMNMSLNSSHNNTFNSSPNTTFNSTLNANLPAACAKAGGATGTNNLNQNSNSNCKQQNFASQENGATKLHISISDDENTGNSEDSGIPKQPRRLDSMTFDEFEALGS